MRRPLDEIAKLSARHGDCPIFVAGDIFDKWNSPPELVNFAMDNVPENSIAIAGQHDVPNHNFSEMKRSAYTSLKKAGTIKDISQVNFIEIKESKIRLFPFPYGRKLEKCFNRTDGWLHIALIHKYFWVAGSKYPNAPKKDNIKQYSGILSSYDVVVIGDNHSNFKVHSG
jgi:hypothetical protein